MTDLLASLSHVVKAGDGWTARCPVHDDARNSLSIGHGADGRWLVKCHAGCSVEAILTALHLSVRDLFPAKASAAGGRRIVATYDYVSETGELLYQACRTEPKSFFQRHPDGHGGWHVNMNGVRRVVYRLDRLHGARTLFVTEGEKDADRLWSIGLAATTNVGGAGKWLGEYAPMLKAVGCEHVVVLPDNDPPGETHGREVARRCVEAGLTVKLIPLPNLPRKGDVSDYLAHHAKEDLLAIVAQAPLFTPHRLVATPQPIVLTSVGDLLEEPDDAHDWIVKDRIAAKSVVLFVAPPKAGKSTAARELALDVSRGDPWLGWPTTLGPVWLLIFEDKRSEVRKHFRRMGATAADPIRLFVDQAPADLLPKLHALAATERPALIVVDTLARMLKVKDFNDYAIVTQAFDPLLKLTRDTGATLLLLFHSSVHVSRDGLDAVLGSTAISGSVDNILILKRTPEHQRVLSSVQRIGDDLEPTVIVMNADTGRLECAGRKQAVDDAELARRMVAAFRTVDQPVAEGWLHEQLGGRKADAVRVLRQVLGVGDVVKVSGKGRKGDPWLYGLAEKFGSRANGNSTTTTVAPEPKNAQVSSANPGLFDSCNNSVPGSPLYSREQNSKYVVTTKIGSASLGVRNAVPAVPAGLKTSANGTVETANDLDKHCSEFGSRPHDLGSDDDAF